MLWKKNNIYVVFFFVGFPPPDLTKKLMIQSRNNLTFLMSKHLYQQQDLAAIYITQMYFSWLATYGRVANLLLELILKTSFQDLCSTGKNHASEVDI